MEFPLFLAQLPLNCPYSAAMLRAPFHNFCHSDIALCHTQQFLMSCPAVFLFSCLNLSSGSTWASACCPNTFLERTAAAKDLSSESLLPLSVLTGLSETLGLHTAA